MTNTVYFYLDEVSKYSNSWEEEVKWWSTGIGRGEKWEVV